MQNDKSSVVEGNLNKCLHFLKLNCISTPRIHDPIKTICRR